MTVNLKINSITNVLKTSRAELKLNKLVKKQVENAFIGNYKSKSKGFGLIFSDLKEYEPGDDVKNIHWKASARTNHIYVKNYEEEKHLNIHVLLDTSKSMLSKPIFNEESDLEKSINFIVNLGISSLKNNDLFGISIFNSNYKLISKGVSGKKKLQITLSKLEKEITTSSESNLEVAIDSLIKNLKKKSLVFVISDFFVNNYESELSKLCAKNDVILVYLSQIGKFLNSDKKGLLRYKCAETNENIILDLSSNKVKKELEANDLAHYEKINYLARKYKAQSFRVLEKDIITTLIKNTRK